MATSQGPLCQISMTRKVGFPRNPGCTFSCIDTEGRDCDKAAWRSLLGNKVGKEASSPFP